MNLFLIGWSPSGAVEAGHAEGALRAYVAELPFFDSDRIECWQAVSGRASLAFVCHEPERVGGIRYVDHDADGMGLFSGRPFQWQGDGEADGRAPLDPGFYRRPAEEWTGDLDGRFAAARYDEAQGTLEVCADPLGAYPLFSGEMDDGTRWISNSAELVRTALRTGELDLSVVASVLSCGYSLRGDPVWAPVRRIPRGTVMQLHAERSDTEFQLLPLEEIAALPGAGYEPDRAARDLAAAVRAGADWPGRPSVQQLSGGRDSRLVFAAALAAGVEFEARTTGTPDSPDVQVARMLSEQMGVRHRLVSADPGRVLYGSPRDAARIVALTSAGATSLEDAAGYPFEQSAGPLPIWLGGQGGEIARSYYGRGSDGGRDALVQQLFGATVDQQLLSDAGRELVERDLERAVDEQLAAGIAPGDVPDVFYVVTRMAHWSGSGFGCVEYAKGDTTAPLWSRRMLEHQLAPAPEEREGHRFQSETLAALSPALAEAPYASKLHLYLRPGSVRFVSVYEQVCDAVSDQPDHPAWEVLDRSLVGELLARDPRSMGKREHHPVWRLATVFMAAEREPVA